MDDDGAVLIPEGSRPKVLETCETNGGGDPHSSYPVSFRVWFVSEVEEGAMTAERVPELDDVLHYAGFSIRVSGKKGIRMITGIPTGTKKALTRDGVAGCTLEETGTVVAWSDALGGADLTLANATGRAHAYKKGSADPVFKRENGMTLFTNVLVSFTDEMVSRDLTMRSYMILSRDGESIVLYGGQVQRSIGYVAYQNRDVYRPGSAQYEYVWRLIRLAYGE